MLQFMRDNKNLFHTYEHKFADLEALRKTITRMHSLVTLRKIQRTDQKEEKANGRENGKSMAERTIETEKQVKTEQPEKSCEQKHKEKIKAYTPAVPFPQMIQKAMKEEKFSKFLEIFKNIEISIPFAESIIQMPKYAKFMKEILSKKKQISGEGIMNLTATCSAVIQRSLQAKMKDLGSFTIPCSIRNYEFKKALCDSGASINLMPFISCTEIEFGGTCPNNNYITDG